MNTDPKNVGMLALYGNNQRGTIMQASEAHRYQVRREDGMRDFVKPADIILLIDPAELDDVREQAAEAHLAQRLKAAQAAKATPATRNAGPAAPSAG
jgi:hypothetical protein